MGVIHEERRTLQTLNVYPFPILRPKVNGHHFESEVVAVVAVESVSQGKHLARPAFLGTRCDDAPNRLLRAGGWSRIQRRRYKRTT